MRAFESFIRQLILYLHQGRINDPVEKADEKHEDCQDSLEDCRFAGAAAAI